MKRAIPFIALSAITAGAVIWIELEMFWPAGWVHAGWVPIIVVSLSGAAVSVLMLIYIIMRILPKDRSQNHDFVDRGKLQRKRGSAFRSDHSR